MFREKVWRMTMKKLYPGGKKKAFNILLDEIIDGYYNSKNIGNRVIPECL